MTRVLIIDPQFARDPDIERAVVGPDVELDIWRPEGGRTIDAAAVADCDAIVNCRSRHVLPAPVIAAMRRTRLIVQAGVGFNHIDLDACARRGIPVCNTPDYCTMEVADHALALALALSRGVVAYGARLQRREDAWSTFALPLPAVRRLRGRVFGIVGLGRIGVATALRARAFEMEISFFDPLLPPGAELSFGFERVPTLDALLGSADFVSLHCPMNAETSRLIDDRTIGLMKSDAVLINTSRGGVIDLDAVERGLRADKLRAAALDVLPVEPLDRTHPLIAAWIRQESWLEGRFILTPHAAFYTPESLGDMRRLAMVAVADYFRSGRLRACVNLDLLRKHGHAVTA